MFKITKKEIQFGDQILTLETGMLANQAQGSVLVKYGETSILCTVVSDKQDSDNSDFLPLSVNYVEKYYAGGKIPGGFFKREGRQSEHEILISRLIDRPLRPIFEDGFYRNVQIMCMVLSYDKKYEPDVAAIVGASAALTIAGLPTTGVVAACRVGYIDGEYVINPSRESNENNLLDLVVAGTEEAILMVESEMKQLPEDIALGAVIFGQSMNQKVSKAIQEFATSVNKQNNINFVPRDRSILIEEVSFFAKEKVEEAYKILNKLERRAKVTEIFEEVKKEFLGGEDISYEELLEDINNQELSKEGNEECKVEENSCDEEKKSCCDFEKSCCDKEEMNCCDEDEGDENCCYEEGDCDFLKPLVSKNGEEVDLNEIDLKIAFDKLQEEVVRNQILNDHIRIDGRQLDDIRNINVMIDCLPVVHGSAIFTRGETQVMSVTTLGGALDEQQIDNLSCVETSSNFMLHYNFHAFSAGEATPPRAPGRREIGHGKLAYRALKPVLPNKESFPYTIRIVSEVLSSDGSTSMATVCSGALALMATGVPIQNPVAGIAMGLIKEGEKYAVLTDIMADEDHLGDMDFKVAGTKDGITALQMDIKINGITDEIMKHALEKAKKARLTILDKMTAVISEPRSDINQNAPKVFSIKTHQSKIPEVIGKGGSVIKNICEKSSAKVEVAQDGLITIFANNEDSMKIAKNMILAIVEDIEMGSVFNAKIKSILPFGIIIDIGFERTGLVHISEASATRINDIFSHFQEGQDVVAKYIGKDEKGRLKFSIKQNEENEVNESNEKKEYIANEIKMPDDIETNENNSSENNEHRREKRHHENIGGRGNFHNKNKKRDRFPYDKKHRDNRFEKRNRNEYNDKKKPATGLLSKLFGKKKPQGRVNLDYSFSSKPKKKKKFILF